MIDYNALFDVIRPICNSYGDMFAIGIINGIIKSNELVCDEKLIQVREVLENLERTRNK